MRAIVKSKRETGLWLEDVPEPRVGPNDVLIRILKTGICGSDIHIFNWDQWAQKTIPVPLVIGHECMGVIERVGDEVSGFAAGDRVCVEGHITCGHCRNCRAGKRHLCRNTLGVGIHRAGGFADFLSVPVANVFKIPSGIADEIAAFLDPLGNAVHTALSFDLTGEDVLITGAGPIGCMAAAVARHVGARYVVVTDINDYRLDLARALGATRVVNVKNESLRDVMAQLGMKEGFDVALEMSGAADAFALMLDTLNYGGRVALLGLPSQPFAIDINQVIFKGMVLKGIYGREMFETWYKMTSMLQSGLDVSPVLTHRYKAADFATAFDTMRTGRSGKVVLDWT